MRNEMGNQNTSGIKEEEKSAIEASEEAQEGGNEEKVMKGENNIISEDQTKDFHEKAEDSPSNHLSAATETNAKRHEPDEKEQRGKESESDELSKASRQSNHSVSQMDYDYAKKADSCYESNMENILPINDKIQIHDQYPVGRETNEGQAESSSSNSESKSFEDSKRADDSTSPLEGAHILLLQDGEEINKLSKSCPMEQLKKKGDYMDRKDNINGLELEKSVCLEGKATGKNVETEKCDMNGIEDISENGQGNNGDVEVPLKVNLNDILSSPTETVPEVSSQNLLVACPEPQEKHIVHAEEMKLTHGKSENGENKPDSDQAQLSDLTVNQLLEATTSTTLLEDFCKENGDENIVRMSAISDLEKVLPVDGDKLIQNGSEGTSVDRKKFVTTVQERYRNTEEIVVMPETVSISNEFTAIDKHDEETKEKYFGQETEKRTQEPWLTRKRTRNKGTSRSFYSFGGENELVSGYHTSQIYSENGFGAAYPASSFNSHSGNGTLMGSGAAEDKNKFTVSLKQNISYEVLINQISTCNAQNAYMQTPNPCNDVQGLTQKVHVDSGTVAQTEMSLSQSNKHIMADETSPLQGYKAQEIDARLSIDSTPDHPSHRGQLRKSPSFEFGLSLDARSEESDQTPLLVRDKSLARSFSGSANIKFQSTMIPSDYGRKSVDYEPIQVEEKTIRMERSNSDISRDSFMNFLKKDAKTSIEHTSEKQDSHAAEEKASESPSQELALTSAKGHGKRRPRSSLFSACICCSAVIH